MEILIQNNTYSRLVVGVGILNDFVGLILYGRSAIVDKQCRIQVCNVGFSYMKNSKNPSPAKTVGAGQNNMKI